MYHHCSGPVCYDLDGVFGLAILVMSADTRVADCLTIGFAVGSEFFGAKRMVISVEVLEFDTKLSCEFAIGSDASECFPRTEQNLVMFEDVEAAVVTTKKAPVEAVFLGFLAGGMEEPTADGRNVVIKRGFIDGRGSSFLMVRTSVGVVDLDSVERRWALAIQQAVHLTEEHVEACLCLG